MGSRIHLPSPTPSVPTSPAQARLPGTLVAIFCGSCSRASLPSTSQANRPHDVMVDQYITSSSSHTGCSECVAAAESVPPPLSSGCCSSRQLSNRCCAITNAFCRAHGHRFRWMGTWETGATAKNSVVSTPVFHSGRAIVVVE